MPGGHKRTSVLEPTYRGGLTPQRYADARERAREVAGGHRRPPATTAAAAERSRYRPVVGSGDVVLASTLSSAGSSPASTSSLRVRSESAITPISSRPMPW